MREAQIERKYVQEEKRRKGGKEKNKSHVTNE
jgi:hypothetical protein